MTVTADVFLDEIDTARTSHTRHKNTDDSYGLYLNDMSGRPVLSAEQERQLSALIVTGSKAAETLKSGADLTRAEKRSLEQSVADADTAKRIFVERNLRLVVSIARKTSPGPDELTDIIQDGNVGLIRAVEKFDGTRGIKFSTYATYWIKQAIQRGASARARSVTMPLEIHRAVTQVHATRSEMYKTLGREPTVEEMASDLLLPEQTVRMALTVGRDTLSLDAPISESDTSSLGSFVPDSTVDVESDSLPSAIRADIMDMLDNLSCYERDVIMARFQMNGPPDSELMSLRDVATTCDIPLRRVQAYLASGLRKLEQMVSERGMGALV